jgi:hypothetical protein
VAVLVSFGLASKASVNALTYVISCPYMKAGVARATVDSKIVEVRMETSEDVALPSIASEIGRCRCEQVRSVPFECQEETLSTESLAYIPYQLTLLDSSGYSPRVLIQRLAFR